MRFYDIYFNNYYDGLYLDEEVQHAVNPVGLERQVPGVIAALVVVRACS